MIISKTPFRISFAGGGTDLKSFYSREPGRVISTSIDKYIYVAVKRQIGIVEHKYKLNWSILEKIDDIADIEHPIIREALGMMDIDFPIEISIYADIPARTGVGSSSTFGVGLLHALYALQGRFVDKATLAAQAAEIEIDRLQRPMGAQDQYAAAHGDLNIIHFEKDGAVRVEPVLYRPDVRRQLEDSLLLFYTGIVRDSSEVLSKQDKKTPTKVETLVAMRDQVEPMRRIISDGVDLNQFGRLMHEGWMLKKSIVDEISSSAIDDYYQLGLDAGALGGKILGAGGGGFLLFYVEPQNHASVKKALADLFELHFRFDNEGSRITYYDQTEF